MEKKKRGILHVAICVMLLCVIWGGCFFSVKLIRHNNLVKDIRRLAVTVDYNVLSNIEEVDVQKGKIFISGWAFHREENDVGLNVVLQPTDDEVGEVLEVERFARNDIAEKFNLGQVDCGFNTEIKTGRIEEDVCYEVLLSLSYKSKIVNSEETTEVLKKITTNSFLYNGELYQYNPKELVIPEIFDEQIQTVVKQGQLYAYDSEHKVWVYQYENRLFCIAAVEGVVPLEESPSVLTAFYTFFDELVPAERKDMYTKLGYDSIEIYLGAGYNIDGNNGKYYAVSLDLPEYPITYVCIGTYGNRGAGWISKNVFQMDIINE